MLQLKLFDYIKDFSLEAVNVIKILIKRKLQKLDIQERDNKVNKHSWSLNFVWKKLYLKKNTGLYFRKNK
jgi:hypothetical protein